MNEETIKLIFDIIPLILSVIAIIISICSIYKQTKLNLFDKRYDVFSILSFLVSVSQQIIDNKDVPERELLSSSRDAYIEVISPFKQEGNNGDLKAFYHNLCLSAIKVNFLFPKKHTKVCYTFVKKFAKYFPDAIASKDTETAKKDLSILLNIIYNDKVLNKLEKHLNIGK